MFNKGMMAVRGYSDRANLERAQSLEGSNAGEQISPSLHWSCIIEDIDEREVDLAPFVVRPSRSSVLIDGVDYGDTRALVEFLLHVFALVPVIVHDGDPQFLHGSSIGEVARGVAVRTEIIHVQTRWVVVYGVWVDRGGCSSNRKEQLT